MGTGRIYKWKNNYKQWFIELVFVLLFKSGDSCEGFSKSKYNKYDRKNVRVCIVSINAL
jgi:hypothetical protein